MQAPSEEKVLRMKPGTAYLPGLRQAREAKGFSIRGLADKAGVVPDTIWRLEMLHKAARQDTRRKLADALGVGIRELRRMETEDGET